MESRKQKQYASSRRITFAGFSLSRLLTFSFNEYEQAYVDDSRRASRYLCLVRANISLSVVIGELLRVHATRRTVARSFFTKVYLNLFTESANKPEAKE